MRAYRTTFVQRHGRVLSQGDLSANRIVTEILTLRVSPWRARRTTFQPARANSERMIRWDSTKRESSHHSFGGSRRPVLHTSFRREGIRLKSGEYPMPYNYKALTTVWLSMLVLFGIAGSGMVSGAWVLLLAATAFSAPLLLKLWPTSRNARALLHTADSPSHLM